MPIEKKANPVSRPLQGCTRKGCLDRRRIVWARRQRADVRPHRISCDQHAAGLKLSGRRFEAQIDAIDEAPEHLVGENGTTLHSWIAGQYA